MSSVETEFPMSVAEKAIALLEVLRPEDVKALPPAKRQRFTDACRRLVDLVESNDPPPPIKAGVLYHLKNGERAL
jgi:hypothetical protein